MDNPSSLSSLGRNIIWQWCKRAYVAAAIIAISWALVTAWPVILRWEIGLLAYGASVTIVGWVAMVLVLGYGWSGSLRAWTGISLTMRQCIPMQAAAWVGRYLPGKLGLLAGKMQVCEQGAGWKTVTGSVLCEQVAFIVSGFALSSLAMPQWLSLMPLEIQKFRTVLLVALFIPLILFMIISVWVAKKHLRHAHMLWGLRLLLCSIAGHFLAGLGFYGLLATLIPTPVSLFYSIGLLSAAHTAGILAIFAPAGLGVREAVIVAILTPQIGWPLAVSVSALQRVLVVIADAFIGLLALGSILPPAKK